MKFIVKLFPEITIKSQSVRLRFIKILAGNIRNILKQQITAITVTRHWDHIEVRLKDERDRTQLQDILGRIPGIHHVLAVEERYYTDLQDIFTQTLAMYAEQLIGKTFCVRVKRRGQHTFNSMEVERYVGGGLNHHISSARVKLSHPDVTVHLEIENDRLLLVQGRFTGQGGYPIGTQEDVLSLISGGFDSGVASYKLIRRGCRVHYCFFNLGGVAHETGVTQMAYYLWSRYGCSHRVRFITIDFAPVVREILEKIDDGLMGVVLKRMMVRVASQLADRHGVQAIVTGEALGQVSSQTLTNLRLIDGVSDTLVLRPLIADDKETIINLARTIGIEDLAKMMPEFCGVISKSPTVKAVKARLEAEEAHFDFTVLTQAVAQIQNRDIRAVAQQIKEQIVAVEIVTQLGEGEVLLDIRSLDEQEEKPLKMAKVKIKKLPFYKLASEFVKLDQRYHYVLYCEQGVMSRLQALYLREQGYHNVKVYVSG